jgi:hypothetical protein
MIVPPVCIFAQLLRLSRMAENKSIYWEGREERKGKHSRGIEEIPTSGNTGQKWGTRET